MILVYSPFCTPATMPYSLTRLYAFLRDNNQKIDVLDLNVLFHKLKFKDFYEYIKKNELDDYNQRAKEFLINSSKVYSENNKKVVNSNDPELLDELYNEIMKTKPKIVAFSIVYNSQAFYTYALLKKLKENNIKTIIGGPAVNDKLIGIADIYLKNEVELLEHLTQTKIKHSDLKVNNVLDYNIYKKEDYFTAETVLPIKTSSSCYYQQCTFCTHHNKHSYYEFDLDNIIKTIKESKANKIFIIDDMIHKKRLLELAAKFKPLNVTWMCQLRPTKDLDTETLKKCYDSGLKIIIWGVESGNDRILKLMKKGTNVKDNAVVIKNSKSVGIKNVLYIMFGFPTEEKEELLDTINFLNDNSESIDLVSTSIFGLQKNTAIYNNPKDYSITEIIETKRTILESKIAYNITKGLTQKEAKKILDNYKKTINKINKYPKEMNFFRVHMLTSIDNIE